MARCLLALGSNLGDRRSNLDRACAALSSLPQSQLLARSRWHQTAPIGGPSGQGQFLNGAAILQTALEPTELAEALHASESQLGRERAIRWDARVIDIDLLLYEDRRIDLPSLTVPHPRMSSRRFVLEPAVEIAGSWVHPDSHWTLAQLLAYLNNSSRNVDIITRHYQLAVWLANRLARTFGCFREVKPPGDSQGLAAVEFTGSLPNIRIVRRIPTKGGEDALETDVTAARSALAIALEPRLPEMLLAAFEMQNEADEKKSGKIFSEIFSEIGSPCNPGPKVIIRSNDPTTIVREAITVIHSAWPDLSLSAVS